VCSHRGAGGTLREMAAARTQLAGPVEESGHAMAVAAPLALRPGTLGE